MENETIFDEPTATARNRYFQFSFVRHINCYSTMF